MSVCIVQTVAVIGDLPIQQYLKYFLKYGINSLIMGSILLVERLVMDKYSITNFMYLCVLILSGMLIYGILNYKFIRVIYKTIFFNKIEDKKG